MNGALAQYPVAGFRTGSATADISISSFSTSGTVNAPPGSTTSIGSFSLIAVAATLTLQSADVVVLEDYLSLITRYHRSRPNFVATVSTVVQPFVDLQNTLSNFPIDFDLDGAIGAQLDIVGKWIGRSRDIPIPIADAWFSFDNAAKGFDYGIWKGPYDSDIGITSLDDETYRVFLRAKIAANTWDGTIGTAAAAFELVFSKTSGSITFVTDNGNMSMTVGIAGRIPSLLFLSLLDQGFLPLKPEGVKANYLVTSEQNTPLFGFDVANDYVAGFDTGSWGVSLSYFTS